MVGSYDLLSHGDAIPAMTYQSFVVETDGPQREARRPRESEHSTSGNDGSHSPTSGARRLGSLFRTAGTSGMIRHFRPSVLLQYT